MDPKKPGHYLTNYLEVCGKMESKRSKFRSNSSLTGESSGSETSDQQRPTLGNFFKTRANKSGSGQNNSSVLEMKKQGIKQDMLKLVNDMEKLYPNKYNLARYVVHETKRQTDTKGSKLKYVQNKYEALSKEYEKLRNISEKDVLISQRNEEFNNKDDKVNNESKIVQFKEQELKSYSKDLLIKFEPAQQTYHNLTPTAVTPDYTLRAKYDVLAQKCDHLEQQIQFHCDDEVNNVGNTNNEFKDGLDQAKVCAKKLENDMQTNSVLIADKVTIEKEIEKYVVQLKYEIDNIKINNASKIDEIENKLSKKKVDMENLRIQQQNELTQMQHHLEQCNNLAQHTIIELNEKKGNFKTLNDQITEIKLENEALQNTNTELLQRIKDTNESDELKKLEEEDGQMKARLDAINKEMGDINTKFSEFQSCELDLQKQRKELEQIVQKALQIKDTMEKKQHAAKRQVSPAPGNSKAPPASSEFKVPPAKMAKQNEKRTVPVATVAAAPTPHPYFTSKAKPVETNQGSSLSRPHQRSPNFSGRVKDEPGNQSPNVVLNTTAITVNSSSSSASIPMDVYDFNNTSASSCVKGPSKKKKSR